MAKASIAQPMVAPTAIGSIPSWLQIWLASATALQVGDHAVGAERRQVLVLRTAVAPLDAQLLDLDHPLAAHRAGVAGVVLEQDGVVHPLAGDLLGAGRRRRCPSCGSAARRRDCCASTVSAVPYFCRPAMATLTRTFLAPHWVSFLSSSGSLTATLPVPRHDDRLEVLAAHHGAGAGASRRARGEGDRAGELDQVLAGAADRHRLQLVVAEVGLDRVLEARRCPCPSTWTRRAARTAPSLIQR